MSLQSLLSADTITVQRATVSKDASGGSTRAWAAVYTGVGARVEDLSASGQLVYLQAGGTATHLVTTQQEGVQARDRILTSDSRTLSAEGPPLKVRGMGGIPTYYEIPCVENRPGA